MLPSCAVCKRSDPRRMIALMALWFGRLAGLPGEGGYFYLCPTCYDRLVSPHLADVVDRLVEQHPFLHRLTAVQEPPRIQPARQAGTHPAAVDPVPSEPVPKPPRPVPPTGNGAHAAPGEEPPPA